MIKVFYISAWILVGVAAAALYVSGTFSAAMLVILSLIVVALVYGLALWATLRDTPDKMPKVFEPNDVHG